VLDHVRQAPGEPEAPLHSELRRLADQLLAEATHAPPNHHTALTLLAADALMTYACEAAAEADPSLLATLR